MACDLNYLQIFFSRMFFVLRFHHIMQVRKFDKSYMLNYWPLTFEIDKSSYYFFPFLFPVSFKSKSMKNSNQIWQSWNVCIFPREFLQVSFNTFFPSGFHHNLSEFFHINRSCNKLVCRSTIFEKPSTVS